MKLDTEAIESAEKIIIKAVQESAFPEEKELLIKAHKPKEEASNRNLHLKRKSHLYRLDPYIDEDGIMRVGGRIKRANLPQNLLHPIIMPRSSHITTLVIRHFHLKTFHAGTNITLNEIRNAGFWIIRGRAAVSSYEWNCVGCRKLRANTASQKMSDLPIDRLEPGPPFTHSGVDLFGPFYIKAGRSQKKRWGVLFTCLASRAVHIEVAPDMTTNSFINAYRRFVSRRGQIRTLRSDCGTNIIGAKNELQAALSEMNNDKIHATLLKDDCDWIIFQANVPHASHMGGVWERMIRSIRGVLAGILLQHGDQLDDDLLQTFMIKAEAVVNSRPLTYQDDSHDSPEPLSPSQLLTMKSKVVIPPPGRFIKEDLYCRRRWRRVQYVANQFWTQWRNENLATLQERRKWCSPEEDVKQGDVILLVEDNIPRCNWPLGVINEVYPSSDGHIRKIQVRTVTSVLNRPVTKVVRLHRPES